MYVCVYNIYLSCVQEVRREHDQRNIYTYMYTYVNIHVYIFLYTCMCVCTTYTCHVCRKSAENMISATYTHTCIHMLTYMYTYFYIHVCVCIQHIPVMCAGSPQRT